MLNIKEQLINKEKEVMALREKYQQEEWSISKAYHRAPVCTKNTLVKNVISDQNKLEFDLNCTLINVKYSSNSFVKDVIYDIVKENSKFSIKRGDVPKFCIWVTQYLSLNKQGNIRVDVDNADYKGIIDGVAQAMMIDDNGINISLHAEISPIEHNKTSYTHIIVFLDKYISNYKNTII